MNSQEYDFRTFQFGRGAHASREDGMCVMEAVAYVAGEPHTDSPQCACPVISAFCRSWNDGLSTGQDRAKWLGEFVWRLPGTRATADIEDQRAWMVLDWQVRVFAPAFLDLLDCTSGHAAVLRGLPEITAANVGDAALVASAAGAAAGDAARAAARDAAGAAAWDAARAAARAAAGDAARAAARDAAGDAAWAAARAAAWAAAWAAARAAAGAAAGDAARDAARAAARDALAPVVGVIQQEARDLLDSMVRLTEIRE